MNYLHISIRELLSVLSIEAFLLLVHLATLQASPTLIVCTYYWISQSIYGYVSLSEVANITLNYYTCLCLRLGFPI